MQQSRGWGDAGVIERTLEGSQELDASRNQLLDVLFQGDVRPDEVGFATLGGNDFFERLRLWVTDPKLYPETHYVKTVPHSVIHKFTMIQLSGLVSLWVLKASAVGILFPILIALLVPLRLMLPRFFKQKHLAALDAEEDPAEIQERGSDVHA